MQCPGYRDQLSLMFRDESTKVIRKAHAQWGLDSPSTSGEAVATGTVAEEPDMTTPQVTSERRGSRTQTGHTSSEHKSPVKSRRPSSASSPISQTGSAQVAPPCQAQKKARSSSLSTSPPAATRPNALSEMGMEKPSLSLVPIGPTIEEQGVHFYVNRYLVGLPDEPKSTSDITASHWIWNPALQHIAAAIGLAGLSNLTGNAGEPIPFQAVTFCSCVMTSRDDGCSPDEVRACLASDRPTNPATQLPKSGCDNAICCHAGHV
jgi:hypothetical protein